MCPQVQLQKPSSATTKLAHMRTAPGKEDQESPLLLRISSSESPASEITSSQQLRLEARWMPHWHISTSAVQRRLLELGLYGQIDAKTKTLLRKGNKWGRRFVDMHRRVKAKGPPSAQHLWELLQHCWKTISGGYLMKLIERMPRVCEAVIEAKGGYFEESKIENMFWVISHFFVYYIIPYVFIHSSDAFGENLQCE